MKEEVVRELLREQFREEPLRTFSVRIPAELYDEIRSFCGQTGIQLATIIRRCIREGWEKVNE